MITIGQLKQMLDEIPEEQNNCPIVLLTGAGYPYVHELRNRLFDAQEAMTIQIQHNIKDADEVRLDGEEPLHIDEAEYFQKNLPRHFWDIIPNYLNMSEEERPVTVFYLVEHSQVRYAIGGEHYLFEE